MSELGRLAKLLEDASVALRRAEKELEFLPSSQGTKLIRELPGWSELPTTVKHALRPWDRAAIETVYQLTSMTEDDLLDLRNFGEVSLVAVKNFMAQNGLKLRQ